MEPLNGRQLRNAIDRLHPVKVVVRSYDPTDEDWEREVVGCAFGDTTVVYFAGMDFDPTDYPDSAAVFDESCDGTVGLYPIPGFDYD